MHGCEFWEGALGHVLAQQIYWRVMAQIIGKLVTFFSGVRRSNPFLHSFDNVLSPVLWCNTPNILPKFMCMQIWPIHTNIIMRCGLLPQQNEDESMKSWCFVNFLLTCLEMSFYCATACNAMHGIAIAILSVRPSVCLSVRHLYCDKTKWWTAVILIPHETAITLVLWHQQ